MAKFVVLAKFTESGVEKVGKSLGRAEEFRASAEKKGVKVESQLWLVGPYDGLLVLDAPDLDSVAALTLSLAQEGKVTTCTLPAYDAEGFANVVGKLDE